MFADFRISRRVFQIHFHIFAINNFIRTIYVVILRSLGSTYIWIFGGDDRIRI